MIELTSVDLAVLMVQCGLVGFALAHLFWSIYLYRESNRECERIQKEIEENLSRFEAERRRIESQSMSGPFDDDSPYGGEFPEGTKVRIRR